MVDIEVYNFILIVVGFFIFFWILRLCRVSLNILEISVATRLRDIGVISVIILFLT